MLSVGIFTYSTRPRGSVVHAGHLAEALRARGHDVTLYALSKAGDRLYRDVACPVVLLPAGPAPEDPEQLIRQRIGEVTHGCRSLARRHDVYHAEDCLVASGLLDGGPAFRPLVRTLHHLERFDSAYLRACQRRSVLGADAVACVSRVSQRDVARELGRRCPIIGNGVDAARFRSRQPALEAELRARLALTERDRIVLSVGGVEPRKNSLRALSAMTAVLAQFPEVKWLIAGGASIWEHDRFRAEFRARLAALPQAVRSRVVELGPVGEQELTALYGVSEVLLCPSTQEGFGLCVLEALASGTPVVVSRGEPFTEYLDAETASFVAPEAEEEIARALCELLGDAKLRSLRAEAGLRRVKRFTWERVAAEHERLYSGLSARVGSRTRPEETSHA